MPSIEVSQKTLELLENWRKRYEKRLLAETASEGMFTYDYLIQDALTTLSEIQSE